MSNLPRPSSEDSSDAKKGSCFAKALDWYTKERKFCPTKKKQKALKNRQDRNCCPTYAQSRPCIIEQGNKLSRQSTVEASQSYPVEINLSSFASWLDCKYQEYIREQMERKGQIKTTETDCRCGEAKVDKEYAYQQFQLYTMKQNNSCPPSQSNMLETQESCCQACVLPPQATTIQQNCQNLRPVPAYEGEFHRPAKERLIKLTAPSTEFSNSNKESEMPSKICPCPDESPSALPTNDFRSEKTTKKSKPRTDSQVNCECDDDDKIKNPDPPCVCPEDPIAIPSCSKATPVKKNKRVKQPTLKCLCEDESIDDKLREVTCPCPTPSKLDKVVKYPKRSKKEKTDMKLLCYCQPLKECSCGTVNGDEENTPSIKPFDDQLPKKEESLVIPVCCQEATTKESIAREKKNKSKKKNPELIKPTLGEAECGACMECSTPEKSTTAKEKRQSSKESPDIPVCCKTPRISTKETLALKRKQEANEKRNKDKNTQLVRQKPEEAECNDCIECPSQENSATAVSEMQHRFSNECKYPCARNYDSDMRLGDCNTVQQVPVGRQPSRCVSDEAQTSRLSIHLIPNCYPIFMKVICPDKLN
ncbi:unnamed protein product [Plutella xylostella]|uniref:(diamondback moth) hypothetical protein n=1 Tax=Plutella xylostella TaxID=51655 RepID=A0A8S4DT77_PLUXY|nr:unnamed protein product [Plutella xylostella]